MDRPELNEQNRRRLATAYEQLKKAAYLAELAAESLSPVPGYVDEWERVRELMFRLRYERDHLYEELERFPVGSTSDEQP